MNYFYTILKDENDIIGVYGKFISDDNLFEYQKIYNNWNKSTNKKKCKYDALIKNELNDIYVFDNIVKLSVMLSEFNDKYKPIKI